MEHYDVVVVGGGIAGASIAHELAAAQRSVCLLEAERELAAHTTGRSAATWIAGYGPPGVQELTRLSRPFLDDPPLDVDGPLATALPCLYVATAETEDAAALAADVVAATGASTLTPEEAARLAPVLRPGVVTTAVLDPTAAELDVYGLALRNARWYAVGHCHLRRGLRSFRIDRVREVAKVPSWFTPPDDFDAVTHLALGLATLPRAHSIEVFLHTDLATAHEQLFATIGVFQPEAGGLRLHSQADDLHWYARQLARLECRFEVIRPRALKTQLARHARSLLALAGVR